VIRRLLVIFLVVLVVAVALAAGAWSLLPDSWIAAQVQARAKVALGRDVEIGSLALHRWPVALEVRDLRVANPEWAEHADLLRLARLYVALDATALLSRTVRLTELVVEGPELALERAADGRPGWRFATAHRDGAGGGGREAGGWTVLVERANVSKGHVIYLDHATGRRSEAEDLSLELGRDAASGELHLAAKAQVQGAPLALTGRLADPARLAAGGRGPAELSLETPEGGLRFSGTVEAAGPRVSGRLDVAFTNLRALLEERLGLMLSMAPDALRTLTLSSPVTAGPQAVELAELKLAVDDIDAQGGLMLAGLDGRPRLRADLAFGHLALDRYLPPPAKGEPAAGKAGAQPAAEGWSDEPIALPLLLPLDVEAKATFAGLSVRGFETGKGEAELRAEGARAMLRLGDLALYDGRVQATVDVVAGPPHDVSVAWRVEGVQARPLLAALAGTDRLEGRTFSEAKLVARGLSPEDLVSTLEGTGQLEFRDGAILGINIAALVRRVTTLDLSEDRTPRRTDFARLAAGFVMEKGILRTDDITLEAPLFRLHGAGTVDLPRRTLSLRLEPAFAATLEGQEGREPVFRAGVPVLIEGPWSAPAWRFDIGGRLTEALRDPARIGELVDRLRQDPQMVERLRERFGGLQELFGVGAGKLEELVPGLRGTTGGGGQEAVSEEGRKAPSPAPATPVPDLRSLVPLIPGGGQAGADGSKAPSPATPAPGAPTRQPEPAPEETPKPPAEPEIPDPGRLLRDLLNR